MELSRAGLFYAHRRTSTRSSSGRRASHSIQVNHRQLPRRTPRSRADRAAIRKCERGGRDIYSYSAIAAYSAQLELAWDSHWPPSKVTIQNER